MIFGGEHDEYQERYATWEEAEEGKEDQNKKKTSVKKKTTADKKKKKKKGLGKFIDKIAEPDAEEYEDFDDI